MDARFLNGTPVPVQYTPGTAKTGGTVIVINGRPLCLHRDLAASEMGALMARGGTYECVADAAIAAGAKVYWDDTNNKVTETPGSNRHFGFLTPDSSAAADGDLVVVEHNPQESSVDDITVVAATGTIQGDAAALSDGFNNVTGADAAKGVILPAARAGRRVEVKNSDAANAVLKVWPAVGDGINAIAVNSAYSMAAKTSAVFVAIDSTTWYTIPLVAS